MVVQQSNYHWPLKNYSLSDFIFPLHMSKLLIFSRRNHGPIWNSISKELTCAHEVKIVSCFPNVGHINIMPKIHDNFYRKEHIEEFALSALGHHQCEEVILRCRLLRNLNYKFALKMIGASWLALEELLLRESPDLIISKAIDYFLTDLLQRAGNSQQIRSLQLCGSSITSRFMLMSNNEFETLCTPTLQDIQEVIKTVVNPNFLPFVSTNQKYGVWKFLNIKTKFSVRQIYLDALRILERQAINPEYLMTPRSKDDYSFGINDYLGSAKLPDSMWEKKLNMVPFKHRVFVGLQVNPECSIDYWVKDLELMQHKKTLEKVVDCLSKAGFSIFIKDHPNMFGRRRYSYFENLKKFKTVVFIPYNINSQYLIKNCKATFTWTGTIGLQAAIYGRCPIVTRSMYYSTHKGFITINSINDINDLPKSIEEFELPSDLQVLQTKIAYQVATTCIPGDMSCFSDKKKRPREGINQDLISSLNKYLPNYL
jgi:hypothetical protein